MFVVIFSYFTARFYRLQIGLFGFVGMLGVATAPIIGRLIDGLIPWMATFIAIIVLLVSQAVQTIGGGLNIGAVVIACFGERSRLCWLLTLTNFKALTSASN